MTDERLSRCRLTASVALAALLWFLMFNPWLGWQAHFWNLMALSSVLLGFLAFRFGSIDLRIDWTLLALGLLIAAALWGVFFVGDFLSQRVFSFSRPQVDSIYGMGQGTNTWRVGLQLLLLTGPAEELFWRGYVQQKIGERRGPFAAMLITLVAYTLIHLWSFNFMLIMAALVAGAAWGLLYYWKPSWLPALVLSHALWDCAVFAVFPI